jgi:hypothetical protein
VHWLSDCRNFRHRVGTSYHLETAGRGPLVRRIQLLPTSVGTSDTHWNSQKTKCTSVWFCTSSWWLASQISTLTPSCYPFASLLIVRCFLNLNLKYKISKDLLLSPTPFFKQIWCLFLLSIISLNFNLPILINISSLILYVINTKTHLRGQMHFQEKRMKKNTTRLQMTDYGNELGCHKPMTKTLFLTD